MGGPAATGHDVPARSGAGVQYHHSVDVVDVMDLSVLDRINDLLDGDDGSTVNTSMRLPSALRDAAALAVERLGVAPSTTTLTASALRSALETAVMIAALDAHFEQHPDARPPLADRPDIIEQAAVDVVARRPGADADDVLLWAEAQQAVTA